MGNALTLVTANRHKFAEIRRVLREEGVALAWKKALLQEPELGSLEAVARAKAVQAAALAGGPAIAEDTGVYFDAYPAFPGLYAKRMFVALGYRGLLKLLKGEKRGGCFRTCIAYAEPGARPRAFCGAWRGTFIEEVRDRKKDVLPYERFFVPKGYTVTMSAIPRSEKNRFSHRAQAARRLAAFLRRRKKDLRARG